MGRVGVAFLTAGAVGRPIWSSALYDLLWAWHRSCDGGDHTPLSVPGSLVRCFPPQGGQLKRGGAVDEERPSLVTVIRGVLPVAHVNPCPRVGLMLREQGQQARRDELYTDLLGPSALP